MDVWVCSVSIVHSQMCVCMLNVHAVSMKKGAPSHKYMLQWFVDILPEELKPGAQAELERNYILPMRIIAYKGVEHEVLNTLEIYHVGSGFNSAASTICEETRCFK